MHTNGGAGHANAVQSMGILNGRHVFSVTGGADHLPPKKFRSNRYSPEKEVCSVGTRLVSPTSSGSGNKENRKAFGFPLVFPPSLWVLPVPVPRAFFLGNNQQELCKMHVDEGTAERCPPHRPTCPFAAFLITGWGSLGVLERPWGGIWGFAHL